MFLLDNSKKLAPPSNVRLLNSQSYNMISELLPGIESLSGNDENIIGMIPFSLAA